MIIKSSATLRNNYRKVADFCIESGQPVFLTNNGEGELVVMSIQAWQEERQRIQVEEALLRVEERERLGIAKYTPAKEAVARWREIVEKAKERQNNE
ncbi:MAG: type II toxin-antitoxin system Phd/YefM family antitoxin [Defluviitaleaceae bacterium]|nr:type II toxin-antitoxin system Phd/YefM family antitoxin [Defluviitaleaceae bacterium]